MDVLGVFRAAPQNLVERPRGGFVVYRVADGRARLDYLPDLR